MAKVKSKTNTFKPGDRVTVIANPTKFDMDNFVDGCCWIPEMNNFAGTTGTVDRCADNNCYELIFDDSELNNAPGSNCCYRAAWLTLEIKTEKLKQPQVTSQRLYKRPKIVIT